MKAEDGPFKYLTNNNWDSQISMQKLCNVSELKTPIIKFRGRERKIIEDETNALSQCIFNLV